MIQTVFCCHSEFSQAALRISQLLLTCLTNELTTTRRLGKSSLHVSTSHTQTFTWQQSWEILFSNIEKLQNNIVYCADSIDSVGCQVVAKTCKNSHRCCKFLQNVLKPHLHRLNIPPYFPIVVVSIHRHLGGKKEKEKKPPQTMQDIPVRYRLLP